MTNPCGAVEIACGPADSSMWAAPGTDWLPLVKDFPLHRLPMPERCKLVSSRSRQRFAKLVELCKDMNCSVDALNWMAGFRSPSLFPEPSIDVGSAESRFRARAAGLLHEHYSSSPATIPSERAALCELLKGRSVYAQDGAVNLASFTTVANVSLPDCLADAPKLADLLCGTAASQFYDGGTVERMLRPENSISASLDDMVAYWDPCLRRNRKKLLSFYRALYKRGLLRITWRGRARGQLGMFFVKKKDGSLRLILDARRANLRFADPPGVSLCSSESFARIEVVIRGSQDMSRLDIDDALRNVDASLWVSDIRDAFHRYKLREAFSE